MITPLLTLVIYALVYALIIWLVFVIAGKVIAKTGSGIAAEAFGVVELIVWVLFAIWLLLSLAGVIVGGHQLWRLP